MQKSKIFGSALIDCVTTKYLDPTQEFLFRDDSLIWFLCKNRDIYKVQTQILKDFKHAFRVAWIYPFELEGNKPSNDFYFLFAAYKNNVYFFDKDPIREKHIWEKVEWGKRKKNYNPKGKDPGTVWIEIEDDGNGKVISYSPYSKIDLLERLKISSLKNKKEDFLVLSKISF